MTPEKKKAVELVDKYAIQLTGMPFIVCNGYYKKQAKQCALIAVEEILNSRPIIPSPQAVDSLDKCTIQAKEYWQKVKTEIQKL